MSGGHARTRSMAAAPRLDDGSELVGSRLDDGGCEAGRCGGVRLAGAAAARLAAV